MSLFCCPLCRAPLTREARAYRCPSGHCYDIAAEGHTHLLPVNQKNSKMPAAIPPLQIRNFQSYFLSFSHI